MVSKKGIVSVSSKIHRGRLVYEISAPGIGVYYETSRAAVLARVAEVVGFVSECNRISDLGQAA